MSVTLGKYIGRGMDRSCYENPENPDTCFKVSKKDRSKQTLREAAYFKFLKRRRIEPSFMPKFYGLWELDDNFVLEQEYIHPRQGEKVVDLATYLREIPEERISSLETELLQIKEEMIRLNVIVSDMRPLNFFVVTRGDEIQRIVIFDGYGTPEFFPLPNYCPFFGKRKINRQWQKFMKYYQVEKAKRNQYSV